MILLILELLLLSVPIFTISNDGLDNAQIIILQHSFDGISFTNRGIIKIQNLKSGIASYHQSDTITSEEKENLRIFSDGIYYLKIESKNNSTSVSAFIKTCALIDSLLSDIINLLVDTSNDFNIIGMSAFALNSHCSYKKPNWEDFKYFNTTVNIQTFHTAPVPDTTSYIQKLEQKKRAKERGETKDNRSFLAKYVGFIPSYYFLNIQIITSGCTSYLFWYLFWFLAQQIPKIIDDEVNLI